MKSPFAKGLLDGIPIALGYLSVSFGFGILAVRSGLTTLVSVLISASNLTSAGQAAGIGIIAAGAMAVGMDAILIRSALSPKDVPPPPGVEGFLPRMDLRRLRRLLLN